MNELKWFFPSTEKDCIKMLDEGYRPHGGGTYLIKTSLKIKGLFSLPDDGVFKTCTDDSENIIIGSAVTYADAANYLSELRPDNLLSKALSNAASTPLRNRITLGGSIAAAPKWSDITGPLTACGAKLRLSGDKNIIDYTDYASNRKIGKRPLISSIIIPKNSVKGGYFRCTLTSFDYPVFSISLSAASKNLRCAVTGTSSGIICLGGGPSEIIDAYNNTISFSSERCFSGEYLKERGLTELQRLINGVSYE